MKRLVLLLTLALGLLAPSLAPAQVNVVPQVGVTSNYIGKTTYSATWVGLVPPASATDLICIAGSSSGKQVKLMSIRFSGTAGTLVTVPVTVLRRASLNTGGTPAGTTANPANTISKRLTSQGAATATLVSYTANPTINDTSPTYIDSMSVTLPTTAAGTVYVPAFFDFGKDVEGLLQPPTLISATEQICVNLNAVSVASGVLNGSITWIEE